MPLEKDIRILIMIESKTIASNSAYSAQILVNFVATHSNIWVN